MAKREQRLKAVRRLENVEIIHQERCEVRWSEMEGDDRVRHCGHCHLNVYNFAGMMPEDICTVIRTHEDRLCAQFYARKDGTMTLEPCAQRETSMLRGRVLIKEREV